MVSLKGGFNALGVAAGRPSLSIPLYHFGGCPAFVTQKDVRGRFDVSPHRWLSSRDVNGLDRIGFCLYHILYHVFLSDSNGRIMTGCRFGNGYV
jgi:hypothetical protein